MLRLGLVFILIAQAACLCSQDDKSLVGDFEDLQTALQVAMDDTGTWGRQINESAMTYDVEVKNMLHQVIWQLQALNLDTTSVEQEVTILNARATEVLSNLTSEVLNVLSQLDQIQIDLGDWITLSEDIQIYNTTWQYLPGLVNEFINDLKTKYVVVSDSVKLLLEGQDPTASTEILNFMYEIKRILVSQAFIITTGLNKCDTSADTLVTATQQYLSNFSPDQFQNINNIVKYF